MISKFIVTQKMFVNEPFLLQIMQFSVKSMILYYTSMNQNKFVQQLLV